MHLLVTDSFEIISRFRKPLLKKGPTTIVGSLSALLRGQSDDLPFLIVIDLTLPSIDFNTVILEAKKIAPAGRILVVGIEFSPAKEMSLLAMGVSGCCSNQIAEATIPRIIDIILDGGAWISHAVLPLLLQELQQRAVAAGLPAQSVPVPVQLTGLTPRERQIAHLVSNGASNKLIARQLSITDRTVKSHLSAIFHKLGMPDRLQLAIYINSSAKKLSS